MRRRKFLGVLGGAAAWPVVARGQQPDRMRRIGVLLAVGIDDPDSPGRLTVMRQTFRSSGWIEGKTLQIDVRFGNGNTKRIQDQARELVAWNPDVLLIHGTIVAKTLQALTRTIPIVFVQVSDPVAAGLISNLSSPGGNFTGFTTYEYTMGGKWLEILKEVSPALKRALLLLNPENVAQWNGYTHALEALAPKLGVQIIRGPVRNREEIEFEIERFAREPNGGLLVPPDAITAVHQQSIIALTLRIGLPGVYPYRFWAANGGLAAYGINAVDQFRRATLYVDRILKGEKAAQLPVEAPNKFELSINLKTAKSLGLAVSPSLLARAEEVIE